MSSPTPLINQWLASLPARTREIIVLAGETIEKFDGNVKMAETLASLAFMRAVESEAGMTELDVKDQAELLKVAGNLVKLAADLKERRLDVLDKYENVADAPKPANMEFLVVEAGIPEQIRRLISLRMLDEAGILCKQNNLQLDDFLVDVTIRETPSE